MGQHLRNHFTNSEKQIQFLKYYVRETLVIWIWTERQKEKRIWFISTQFIWIFRLEATNYSKNIVYKSIGIITTNKLFKQIIQQCMCFFLVAQRMMFHISHAPFRHSVCCSYENMSIYLFFSWLCVHISINDFSFLTVFLALVRAIMPNVHMSA